MSKGTNRDDVDRWHAFGLNFATRTIFLDGDDNEDGIITANTASQFIKNMHVFQSAGSDEITVIINTPGGEVDAGMAIFDTIANSKCFVSGIVYRAESMGSIILQACDSRVMMPHGKVMIHKGSIGFGEAHSNTAYKWVEEAKRDDLVCESILLRRIKEKKPKFTRMNLKSIIEHDSFFNAKKAVEFGLADKIYE